MRTKITILSLFVALFFFGCSKDEEDDAKTNSLVNTVWEEVHEYNIIVTYTFTSDIAVVYKLKSGSRVTEYDYTYEYNHPNVDMFPNDSDNAKLKGYISDSKMNIVNISAGKTIANLTKIK